MRIQGLSRLLFTIIISVQVTSAFASDVTCEFGGNVGGFGMSSELCLELTEDQQLFYTIGMMGGWFSAGALGGTQACQDKLSQCVVDKSNNQLAAVVRQFVKDHPESWHYPINVNAGTAVIELCKLYEIKTAETQGN